MREVRSPKYKSIPLWISIGLAACAALAAALSPAAATEATDYPWCVSRENNLDCVYATRAQCEATASGIAGCAPNPRVLFPQQRPSRFRDWAR
jgi:Protein of unknown function (DUF3551)